MDELVPIGEFSQRSGLSPKRLRSYAAAGLLVPAAVDSVSGYRYYAPGQLRDARLIDELRNAGVALADIAAWLRDPNGEHLEAWAEHLEVEAAQRREALEKARRLLAADAVSSRSRADQLARSHPMLTMHTVARSDIGRVRESNQDAVVAGHRLAVVADGMGGSPGGDVASTVVTSLLMAAFTGRSVDELEAAVRAANRAIWDRARTSDRLEGMGTTVCAVGIIDSARLAILNVGDSRAYLLHDGTLTQLTNDHSVTAEAVRRGELSEDEVLDHPHRSVLTRAVGIAPEVELDSIVVSAAIGDWVLLCSDGLVNEVPDDEILSVMSTRGRPEPAADHLMELALANGGRDNISVVIAEICAEP